MAQSGSRMANDERIIQVCISDRSSPLPQAIESLHVGEDAKQRIATTRSQKRTTRQNSESRRPQDSLNLSLHPFLHVGIPLHSRNGRLHPVCFGSPMYCSKQQSVGSQNSPETRQRPWDFAGTNVKKAERSPETVKACFRKIQIPHIHFFDVDSWNAFFCEPYETIGQVNRCYVVTQLGKSLGIHSWTAATVENFRSGRQSLNKLPSFSFDKLVRRLEVVAVVFRTLVVGLFDVRIVRVFGLHIRHLSQQ
jgi:hypothetical protein